MLDTIIHRLSKSRASLPARKLLRKLRETYYNTEVLNRISDKIKPIPALVDKGEPKRINIIIPEINFQSFYGGYIAKFNLAKLLIARGNRVRILLVDQCSEDPATWEQCVSRYPGLENVLDMLEVEYCYRRNQTVSFNPNDGVIATTWWTAYIAHSIIGKLNTDNFLYMIQEYEPFTFAMGSYYAVAHESYSLPHHAIFSSELLLEYFRNQKIGVFTETSKAEYDFFENAIISYSSNEYVALHAGPKKLLFYARPEAHAARNMFEVAYQALSTAIEQGVFQGDWEFYGIGTRHGDIALPDSKTLKMLGKFDLNDYRQALLGYDVGLALMYTPHPSLLPLEMAAAGMVVVTSQCMNKTEQRLKHISENIIAAQPTIDGVANSLAQAVTVSGENSSVSDQPTVNWPSNWTETFDDAKLNKICTWVFN